MSPPKGTKNVFGTRAHMTIVFSGDPGEGLKEVRNTLESLVVVEDVRVNEVGRELISPKVEKVSMKDGDVEPLDLGEFREIEVKREKPKKKKDFSHDTMEIRFV